MKIQTNDADGRIIFYPVSDPRPLQGWTIREVESIPERTKGQRLIWQPTDPVNPKGPGTVIAIFVPPPVPAEVMTYKVFGQLAKEVMAGDSGQMKAALTQAGTMTNLLMEMTKAAPEEQIPAAMKPVALNEIERTQTIQRKHPFIDLYGPAFGYVTEEEKDAFFIRAEAYVFGA